MNYNEYNIDFGSYHSYAESLAEVRRTRGEPVVTIEQHDVKIYRLRFLPNKESRQTGVVLRLLGFDTDQTSSTSQVSLVLQPEDLYIAGFVVSFNDNNHFYRFNDMSHISIANVNVINLNIGSSYTDLERPAHDNRTLNRGTLNINRFSLQTSFKDISKLTPDNLRLNYEVKAAILRFITVTSEAIRFRQIERNFSHALNISGCFSYTLNMGFDRNRRFTDMDLTLQWGTLSDLIETYDGSRDTATIQLKIGSHEVTLDRIQILQILALLLPSQKVCRV